MITPTSPDGTPPLRGLALSRAFWLEAVESIARRTLPAVPLAAALLGPGSEVLGFDDETSTDHGWGPRLQLFLPDDALDTHAAQLHAALAAELPHRFRGYPTSFYTGDDGSPMLDASDDGPVRHRVEMTSVRTFYRQHLHWDPAAPPTPREWLEMPPHRLRPLSPQAGAIFCDDSDELSAACAQLQWYPEDVWRYLLAVEWERIAEEQPFVARTAQVRDTLGSRIIAARQAQTLMRIAFLQARQYAPYSKWFGTAFSRLPGSIELQPDLDLALTADAWYVREGALVRVGSTLLARQNTLDLCAAVDLAPLQFHSRDIRIVNAEAAHDALLAAISDAWLRALPPRLGSLRQIAATDDILEPDAIWQRLRRVYANDDR